MKTYDMTHHLRRLVFGGLLLAAAALLPGCGGPKSEKTDDGDDRIRHRIEYNAVEVDTLRLRSFTRELISNGRLLA